MKHDRRYPVRALLAATCATAVYLLAPAGAFAATTFYETEASWQAAVSGAGMNLEDLDLADPARVAEATEVASPPSDGTNLGTAVLTFETAATGLSNKLVLTMLESPSIVFRTTGTRTSLEPSGSQLEDFEHSFPDGVFAFGFQIIEHQGGGGIFGPASSWECFDSLSTSLGSLVVSEADPDQGQDPFIGVVSDSPVARCEFTHTANENLALREHRLGVPPACPVATSVDYGGFTAADCASSVKKVKNQTQLDAYLADFGVGGGTKPKHLNVLFNPAGGDVGIISPCRVKLLGVSKLIDVTADNVCIYGRAGVTIGAGTPAAGSLIDTDVGEILLASLEGKVQTKSGIAYIAGDMELDAELDADVGTGSTVDATGPLAVTSVSGEAEIQSGADVTADSLTVSADQGARIGNNGVVDVTGDLTMTSTSSAAEIQSGTMVTVGGALSMTGLSCKIGGSADVDVTGTATLAASGSATASDAEILSNASLAAADVSQTAEHKAVLGGGATIDAGAGNAEIDAAVCVVNGTVTSGSTSGSCLP